MTTAHDLIIKILQGSSNPLSLNEILKKHKKISKRTAQRWVNQLVQAGMVGTTGEGPARRYYFISNSNKEIFQLAEMAISIDSRDILNYVNQPISARKPVGYHFEFLQSYEPNKTFYLSQPLRAQLRKMGNLGESLLKAGTYERTILGRLLIDLTWASSNLEGNTYSLLDTRELIEHGKIAKGKNLVETQMILNHKAAIEFLSENINAISFNRHSILNLHSALAENLLANPDNEGQLRQHIVSISKSVYHPLSVPQQINDAFTMILNKAEQIKDPFEQSFFVMVHIPYLQPFIDINKRTSRLAANIPLIRNNLCPLTFLGVTETFYTAAILGIYELNRIELLRDLFVWAYQRSTQEYVAIKQDVPDPDPLRLQYRDVIREIVHDVVLNPIDESINLIEMKIKTIEAQDRENVKALVIEELRRLHEGILTRYNLRISDFENWKAKEIRS